MRLNPMLPAVLASLLLAACASTPAGPPADSGTAARYHAVASQFMRCQVFYKHFYESLKIANPQALETPPFSRLPHLIQVLQVSSEALVGVAETRVLYKQKVDKHVPEFVAAAEGSGFKPYAAAVTDECQKVLKENNTEEMNGIVDSYAARNGIVIP